MRRVWLAILIVLFMAGLVHSADIRTGGGHSIENEGSPVTQRPVLNFVGSGVNCVDDAGNSETDCTIDVAGTLAANYYVKGNQTWPILLHEFNDDYTVNTHWTTGKLSNGLLFDGVADWAHIATIDDGIGGDAVKSFEFWVKFNRLGGNVHGFTDSSSIGAYTLDDQADPSNDISTCNQDVDWFNTPAYTTGKMGYAVDLESTSSQYGIITRDTCNNISQVDFTIDMWVKPETLAANSDMLFSQQDGTGTGRALLYHGASGSLKTGIGGTASETATGLIANGTWAHIGMTYQHVSASDCTIKIYTNGVLRSTFTRTTGCMEAATGNYVVGSTKLISTVFWDGLIDDIHFSNTVRDLTYFQDRYNMGGVDQYRMIIGKGHKAAGALAASYQPAIYSKNHYMHFQTNNVWFNTTSPIQSGTWYHVAWVFDNNNTCASGSKVKLYLNNVDTALTNNACADGVLPTDNNRPLMIGRNSSDSTWKTFGGILDELLIWNKAMSAGDVNTRYNGGTGTTCAGNETNLDFCWKFNETSGRVAAQSVSYSNGGSDSNDGLSTSTPFLTLSKAISTVQGLAHITGTTIVHIASGYYNEAIGISGYTGDGLTIRGYNNPTTGQFSNASVYSGTATATSDNNYPSTTGSLITSNANFLNDYKNNWIRITAGTGYNASFNDFDENWYPIDNSTAGAAQIYVVGDWKNGSPTTDTTFDIYSQYAMTTIGSSIYQTCLDVNASSNISIENIRSVLCYQRGFAVRANSSMDYMRVIASQEILGRLGQGRAGRGVFIEKSYLYRGINWIHRKTHGQNVMVYMNSSIEILDNILLDTTDIDAGLLLRDGSTILQFLNATLKGAVFFGLDIEQAGYLVCGGNLRIVSNGSSLYATTGGYWIFSQASATACLAEYTRYSSLDIRISNNTGIGLGVKENSRFGLGNGTMTIENNQSGDGILCDNGGSITSYESIVNDDSETILYCLTTGSGLKIGDDVSGNPENGAVLLYTRYNSGDCKLSAKLASGTIIDVATLVTAGVCP